MPARIPSLEPPDDAVKQPELGQKSRPGRLFKLARLVERQLDGWEPFAVTVGWVLAAALLAVPRAAAPSAFPVPLVDAREAAATRLRAEALVARAHREGLPFETRAVGDGVRRLGRALSSDGSDAEHAARVLAERVEVALGAGQLDALERLRAVQASLFVRAVRDHSWSGPPSKELAALGGDFAERARQNGWASADGCIATDDELSTLFRRRWAELTRLRDHPRFKPSLGELRRYFRFLLLHPERARDADGRDLAFARLRYVQALARYDGEYPASLARGALYGSLGMSAESAAALGGHLARPATAEWALLARNYLLHAAQGHEGDAFDSADDAP
jgi:hypothetical protein